MCLIVVAIYSCLVFQNSKRTDRQTDRWTYGHNCKHKPAHAYARGVIRVLVNFQIVNWPCSERNTKEKYTKVDRWEKEATEICWPT